MLFNILTQTIEFSLNQYLSFDKEMQSQLYDIDGVVIEIYFSDLDFSIYFQIDENRIHCSNEYSDIPNARLCASTFALMQSLQEPNFKLPLPKGMMISGDMEILNQFSKVLQKIEIDWEEGLSKCIGDIPAYQLGNIVRRGKNHVKSVISNFKSNFSEYLKEEKQILPTKPEVEDFLSTVDQLQVDVDRIEARIRKIEREKSTGFTKLEDSDKNL